MECAQHSFMSVPTVFGRLVRSRLKTVLLSFLMSSIEEIHIEMKEHIVEDGAAIGNGLILAVIG